MSEDKFKKIIDEIDSMSAIDLSELVKALEEKFGVSAAAAAAPATDAGAGADSDAPVNMVLKEAGDQKINIIKAVKEITGLGLKDAKDLVDGAPKPIKEGVKKEEAEEMKKKLEEAGGIVELQ